MTERVFRGLAAAGGVAIGPAFPLVAAPADGTSGDAAHALERAADELAATATALRAEGLAAEADILDANRLMALDPTLRSEVVRLAAEQTPAEALRLATERHAEALAALDVPYLAARADDVRELGRRAVRLLGDGARAVPTRPSILVAADLGPAEVAELRLAGDVALGLALAGGAVTSHAAIMARALGLPMVVGLGDAVLALEAGEDALLDGDDGLLAVEPSADRVTRGRDALAARRRARRAAEALRALPSETRDGVPIRLLCNAATPAEVEAGLAAGADGVGLLRTELAFLEAPDWPDEDAHAAAVAPALALLADRPAVVRVLDFGGDKTPPFLADTGARGIWLLLQHPDALAAQLRGILRARAGSDLRVLIPLVTSPRELRSVRALLAEAAAAVGAPPPPLGAMVETPEAAARATELALEADFLSIGTNDLVQYTLGLDRERPEAALDAAADPAVLASIARVAAAGRAAGLAVEVCGEAAGEPHLAALFVGLGVTELSITPTRLDDVRAAVRSLTASDAERTAQAALECGSAREAAALGAALLGQARHDAGELPHGRRGVVA